MQSSFKESQAQVILFKPEFFSSNHLISSINTKT